QVVDFIITTLKTKTGLKMELIKFEDRISKQGHKYALITFNRPKAMNALNAQLLEEFSIALDQVMDGEYRALVLTGEGKAFVAGADISEFVKFTPDDAM